MVLRRIDIQGFKSFAAHTRLDLSKQVVAIVGPNGSGKSNIADAVRWCLGEQSFKALRGKRSHDVIFSGSDRKSRLGFAEVSLLFDNAKKIFPLDYSEVGITRRVYQDGESEYFVNRRPVRLNEIVMLLAKAHFGQKSYSIISQGMIDSIVTATPEERKLFFDEATGVKEFQIKRDSAIRKLAHTQENCAQAQVILQEITPRLRSLQRQVRRLEQRTEKEGELRRVQVTYYGALWHELAASLHEVNSQLQTHEEDFIRARKKLTDIEACIDHAASEKSQAEEFRALQKKENALLEEKNALMKKLAAITGRLEGEQERIGGTDLVWLGRRREELARQINGARDEQFAVEKAAQDIAAQLEITYSEQDRVVTSFRELEYTLLKLRERHHPRDHEAFEQELKTLYEEQERFVHELVKTQDLQSFKQVKEKAIRITESFAKLLDTFFEAGENRSHEKDITDVEQRLKALAASRNTVVNSITELKIKHHTSLEKIELLANHLAALEKEKIEISKEIERVEQARKEDSRKTVIERIEKEKAREEKTIAVIDDHLRTIRQTLNDFQREEEKKRQQIFLWQKEARDFQDELNAKNAKVNDAKVELARLETRSEDLDEELSRELPPEFQAEVRAFRPHETVHRDELLARIQKLKHDLELIGGIDPETVKEYEETKTRHEFLTKETDDLTRAMTSLEAIIDELDTTIKKQFSATFHTIQEGFNTYFRTLFEGGHAKLSLIQEAPLEETLAENGEEGDKTQPAADEPAPAFAPPARRKMITGIELEAQPPGKRLKDPSVLSGGEKALTAIALLSAILHANPSPFVVLDEVEAALDEANSERFRKILRSLAKQSQFILITHNRVTMEEADVLYGVTMGLDGVSKVLSVKLEDLSDKVIGKQLTAEAK